jgi:hypothetical protein
LFKVIFHLSVDLSSGRLSVSWSSACFFSFCRLVFRPSVCLLVVYLSSIPPFFLSSSLLSPVFLSLSAFLSALCLSFGRLFVFCLSVNLSVCRMFVCLSARPRKAVCLPACLCKTIIFFLHPFTQSVSLSIYLSASSNPCVHLGTCCVACTLTRHALPVWVRWVRQAGVSWLPL